MEWRSAVVHNGKLPKKRKGKNNTRPHTTDEVDEFIKSSSGPVLQINQKDYNRWTIS